MRHGVQAKELPKTIVSRGSVVVRFGRDLVVARSPKSVRYDRCMSGRLVTGLISNTHRTKNMSLDTENTPQVLELGTKYNNDYKFAA